MRTTHRIAAAAVTATVAVLTVVGTASAKVDPSLNHTTYWEQGGAYTCSKVDLSGGTRTWTIEPGAFYVIKAGTTSTVVQAEGDTATTYTSAKDISHVITCVGAGQNE
ncbi:hypothetical protein [Phycicoccus avicenniae]|uniref:hypothetical protein n=1 Tax=Phycicoccus avicenniae TaxID=2828860 RepID=UPI003D2C1DBB